MGYTTRRGIVVGWAIDSVHGESVAAVAGAWRMDGGEGDR